MSVIFCVSKFQKKWANLRLALNVQKHSVSASGGAPLIPRPGALPLDPACPPVRNIAKINLNAFAKNKQNFYTSHFCYISSYMRCRVPTASLTQKSRGQIFETSEEDLWKTSFPKKVCGSQRQRRQPIAIPRLSPLVSSTYCDDSFIK